MELLARIMDYLQFQRALPKQRPQIWRLVCSKSALFLGLCEMVSIAGSILVNSAPAFLQDLVMGDKVN